MRIKEIIRFEGETKKKSQVLGYCSGAVNSHWRTVNSILGYNKIYLIDGDMFVILGFLGLKENKVTGYQREEDNLSITSNFLK